MLNCRFVGELLERFDLGAFLQIQVSAELGTEKARELLARLYQLPLKNSRAVTRLGSYSFRDAKPLAIRLQFAQEEESLRQTLLHEIAHFLDHQTLLPNQNSRQPHGRSWQRWLERLGGQQNSGNSAALQQLYRQRLKPVARCKNCGALLKRLRRLPRGRRWLHRECGGLLVPLD